MSRIPIRVLDDVVGNAFLATDEEFLSSASKPSCGSTATTAMILGDKFYMFNLGDSRTILCRSGEAHLVSQVLLFFYICVHHPIYCMTIAAQNVHSNTLGCSLELYEHCLCRGFFFFFRERRRASTRRIYHVCRRVMYYSYHNTKPT